MFLHLQEHASNLFRCQEILHQVEGKFDLAITPGFGNKRQFLAEVQHARVIHQGNGVNSPDGFFTGESDYFITEFKPQAYSLPVIGIYYGIFSLLLISG